jgi:peptide chain release factor subunit 3
MLVRTAGVQRLIVVVNKMDESTVQWSKERCGDVSCQASCLILSGRYDEIVGKMTPFIKGTGFATKMVTYIPVSAFTGANLKEAVKKDVCSWYTCVISQLDQRDLVVMRRTADPRYWASSTASR